MPSDDNKLGLGQNLSRVFARTGRKEPSAPNGCLEVDIDRIEPAAKNPRTTFAEGPLQDLAESIRQHGILQPLTVCREGDGYRIIAGERRYRAARLLGLGTVPVVVHEAADERELAELQLIENIQREDLDPIELATAYHELIERFGLSQEELARQVGKDRSSVSNTLRLLGLTAELRTQLQSGRISVGHAKSLLGLPDEPAQREVGRRVAAEGLSVRETEQLVRRYGKRTRGKAREKPPHLRELETNLYRLFGAPVTVRERAGKGSLTISFNSKAGFQRIVEVLRQTIETAKRSDGDED